MFYFKFQLSQHYVNVHEGKNTVFVAIEAHEEKNDNNNVAEEVRESSSDLTNVTLEEGLPTLPENEENAWRKNQYLQRLNSELSSEPDHENISKIFKCNFCGFNFSKKVFLQHHIVKAHTQKKKN